MDYVRKKWWRAVDGVVSEDNGFSYPDNSDYWYFDVDPENYWQDQIPEEGDPRMMHVDDLFETYEEAANEAVGYCFAALDEYERKLEKLGASR